MCLIVSIQSVCRRNISEGLREMVYVICIARPKSKLRRLLEFASGDTLHAALATTKFSELLSLDALLLDFLKLSLLYSRAVLRLGSRNASLVRVVLVIGTEAVIPPPEASGIAVDEGHVVEVVVVCASPEGDPVTETPWEIVSRVSVDGLEQAQGDPDIDCENVEIGSDHAVEEGSTDCAQTKNENFNRVSVFGGLGSQLGAKRGIQETHETEGSRELVVKLVNVLVQRS